MYLVRELAAAAPDTMSQLLPALADAVRHSHYAHACHLQASCVLGAVSVAGHMGCQDVQDETLSTTVVTRKPFAWMMPAVTVH